MKLVITVKDHGEVEQAAVWVRFTIYRGVFPKREIVGYAATEANAELIARGIAAGNTITRVFGKPDRN